jgi:uncharacterized protein (DUF3820 family)
MLTVRFSLGRAVCCGHPAIRTVATGYGSTAVDTVLTFGKHKGTRLADVPRDYIVWLRTSNISQSRPELEEGMKEILGEDWDRIVPVAAPPQKFAVKPTPKQEYVKSFAPRNQAYGNRSYGQPAEPKTYTPRWQSPEQTGENLVWHIGKHKNKPLKEVPMAYLQWAKENLTLAPHVKEAIAQLESQKSEST